MKHECGEVIGLVWPDGNDDGEFSVKGHFEEKEAREILLDSHELECLPHEDAETEDWQRAQIEESVVEPMFARWSTEARVEEYDGYSLVLRHYRERGPGRFPVMRIRLWPDTRRATRAPE